jgi:hypothetical protein
MMRRASVLLLVLLSSCTYTVQSVRMQPVAVVSETDGVTVWIEEAGERRELGPAPTQVEVPWRVIEKRFPMWTVWIPVTGAAFFGGAVAMQGAGLLDHDKNYAFTVLGVFGFLTLVLSAPFVIVGWLQDGTIVSERPVPGTRIGVSLPGHEDDVRSLDNERYAQSSLFVFRATPRNGIEEPLPIEKPKEPASAPRKDLPEELRPDRYQPTE